MVANTQLVTVQANLEKLIDAKRDAMPSSFNKTRFIQNCMTVLVDTKDIDKCDAGSVARTMLKGAFLGLDFFNKECYAIAYGGIVTFQTDYKGEKKLAKKYSIRPILDIYAKLIREGDEFEEAVIDGRQTINYKPMQLNEGKIKGAFALVLFEDGGISYEVMTVTEMEDTRKNYSKQANGKAWDKSVGEMYKKTVFHRLCKNIELDFESIEQKQAFEDGKDYEPKKQPEQNSPFNVVDIEHSEVTDEADQG